MAFATIKSKFSGPPARSVEDLTGPPVPIGPEGAVGANRTIVVDTFLMRAANDAIRHSDAQHVALRKECRDLRQDFGIVANIAVGGEPLVHIGRFRVFVVNDRDYQLRRSLIVRAIERDGRGGIATEALLGFLR